MGEPLMDQKEMAVVNYIKDHVVDWLEEKNIIPFPPRPAETSTELLERMVRVEMQIAHQNEKFEMLIKTMDKRFEDMQITMDKRFEQVDKRFEDLRSDLDKRFSQMFWFVSVGFIALGTLMSVYQFLS